MTITNQCAGCLRIFTLPMHRETDEKMGQPPVKDHFLLTCVCGTENTFPLMSIQKFPLKTEVPV